EQGGVFVAEKMNFQEEWAWFQWRGKWVTRRIVGQASYLPGPRQASGLPHDPASHPARPSPLRGQAGYGGRDDLGRHSATGDGAAGHLAVHLHRHGLHDRLDDALPVGTFLGNELLQELIAAARLPALGTATVLAAVEARATEQAKGALRQ